MLPVALLAGGMATRLGTLTLNTPKSLITIEGSPFISYQLRALRRAGFTKVVICVANFAEQIINFVGDGREFGLEVLFSFDGKEPRGTGGGLKSALPLLGSDFFVQYGDSYLQMNYEKMESCYKSLPKKSLMAIMKNDQNLDRSNVKKLENNLVTYSKANPSLGMNFVDYGCTLVNFDSFSNFASQTHFDLSLYFEYLSSAGELCGFEVHKRFYEIGSVRGIQDFTNYVRNNLDEL